MAQQQFPQQFGKYILLRKIAMGGMAEIFRAKTLGAEGFEKDIVIKRILPHYTEDEDFVKMFIDEATIAAKLQHANIVQIFDFNMQDGSYYIAMEYVEGKDLKKILEVSSKNGKPLSVESCVWVIMEICKGLHYAHTKTYKGKPLNIVHRDISPQNAMISFNGEVKLMDFGIAKAASRSTKTVAGTVKGKCAYMSPEQARGKPLDGRSDLFALAVVAWEMMTRKRLFLGDSDFMTLSNVLKQEVPPPSSINPAVPPEMDALVLQALSKNRDDRFADVKKFETALTRWFYANVDDPEEAQLGPWMRRTFTDDIQHLHELQAAERTMMYTTGQEAAVVAESASVGRSHSQAQSQAQSQSQPQLQAAAPRVDPAQATVALQGHSRAHAPAPLTPATGSDVHSAKTLLDDGGITGDQVRAALARAQVANDAATRALTAEQMSAHLGNDPAGALAQPGTGPRRGRVPTGMDMQGTGVARSGPGRLAPAKKSRAWLWVLLLLILAGGGVAAFFLATGEDGKPPPIVKNDPTTSKSGTEALYAIDPDVQPPEARDGIKITVNGKALDDGALKNLRKNQKVKVVAEAKGYERFVKTVTLSEHKTRVTIAMKRLAGADPSLPTTADAQAGDTAAAVIAAADAGPAAKDPPDVAKTVEPTPDVSVAAPGADVQTAGPVSADAGGGPVAVIPTVKMLVKPSDPNATVVANGKVLGAGNQTVEGPAGTEVTVEIRPSSGPPIVKKVVLAEALTELPIEVSAAVAPTDTKPAKLVIKVAPRGVKLTTSAGSLSADGSAWTLTGLNVGDSARIEAKKRGFDKVTKDVTLDKAQGALQITLKKKAEEKGFGNLRVQARPWARVQINGAAKGTTPKVFKNLPTGRYRVTLTKGSQSKSKTVKVRKGKTSSVFVDFSQ